MKLVLKDDGGFSTIVAVIVLSTLVAMAHLGAKLYVNSTQKRLSALAKAKSTKNEARAALEISSVLLRQENAPLISRVNGRWTPSVINPPGSFSWSVARVGGLASPTPSPASSASNSFAAAGLINSLPPSPSGNSSTASGAISAATPVSAKEQINVTTCSPRKMSPAELVTMFGNQSYPNSCATTKPIIEIGNLVNEKIDVTAKFENQFIKARIHTSDTPSTPFTCSDYKSNKLINTLFVAYLGRNATPEELAPIMACVSSGKLTLSALESNSTHLCNNTLSGLLAFPDFNYKRTKVNTLFQLYLGRLPLASEESRVGTYMGFLRSSSPSLNGLGTVISHIKTDYALGSNFTAYHREIVENLFKIYYRGRTLDTAAQNQLNNTVFNLANGALILTKVSELVRSSWNYSSSLVNSENISLARQGEQFSSLYQVLTDTLPSIQEEMAYAQLMNFGKTDSVLNPLEWVSRNLKSQTAFQLAGGCVGVPPPPQIFIKYHLANENWAKYNPESCICAKGLAGWPANGSCASTSAPISCPTGQRKIRAYLPRPVEATALITTTVFGARTSSSFNGVIESAGTLNQLSFSFPPLNTGTLAVSERTFTANATGPGGNTVKTQKLTTSIAKKPAVVISQTNKNNGHGPRLDNRGYPLTNLNITNSIPTVAIVHNVGNKLFLDEELTRLGAKQLEIVYAVYNKCNYVSGIPGGGMRGNGSTICSPLVWKDPFSTPVVNSIGVEPPAYNPNSEFRMTLDGTDYLLRTANSSAGLGQWATDPWVQSFTTNWSPLVIDFKNEGVQMTDINEGVSFDLVGDGKKDGFSWIQNSNDAAFVVLDRNGNGQIDDIHELFGDNTNGPDGKKSANGFESLKKYDLNNDGLINSKDAVFGKLQVWFDRNHNGISEASELSLLQEEGVLSLDLDYLSTQETNDRFGNESKQKSVALMADGSFRTVFDLYFVGANVKGKSNLNLATK